jgi:hypothetical protein
MNTIAYEIYRKGDMVPTVITDNTVYVERIKEAMGQRIEIRIVHNKKVKRGK